MNSIQKTGRNDRCPCGSGRKFKHCHGAAQSLPASAADMPSTLSADQLVRGGLQLQQVGDLDAAELLYRKALELAPQQPDAFHLLGLLNHQKGKSREAIALIESAIQAKPGVAEFHNNCGEAYRAAGLYKEAIAHFNRALELSPDFAESLVNRGVSEKHLGDLAGAERSYRAALAKRPAWKQAHANLGNLLRMQARHAEAEAEYRLALSGAGSDAQLLNDLGVVMIEARDGARAREYLLRANELDPENAETMSNLGMAYELQLNTRRAIEMYELALAKNPNSATILRNLGLALYNARDLEGSVRAYERSLVLEPENADTHVNLAFSLFSSGRLLEAWTEYAWREKQHADVTRLSMFKAPEWKGEDLSGKSMLTWGEQGVGDQLWFAGMYEELLERLGVTGKLVVECAPKLRSLLQRSFPAATIVPQQNPPVPATQDVILQISGGNLGGLMRERFSDFPERQSYLRADAERVQYWRRQFASLGAGLKVGICWRSNNASGRRADAVTALSQWGDILRVPGVQFINLQYDECSAELAAAETQFGTHVHHFADIDMFDDLDDTAALTCALDLVISAPTSVSVLAPALGVPTWQLNYIEDWRAFGRSVNPWFPSLRSWNRACDEDWQTVLHSVAIFLEELAVAASKNLNEAAQSPPQMAGRQ